MRGSVILRCVKRVFRVRYFSQLNDELVTIVNTIKCRILYCEGDNATGVSMYYKFMHGFVKRHETAFHQAKRRNKS